MLATVPKICAWRFGLVSLVPRFEVTRAIARRLRRMHASTTDERAPASAMLRCGAGVYC